MNILWQSSRVRTLDLLLWYFLSSFVFLVGSQISGRIRGRGVGMFFFVTSRYYQDYRSDYQLVIRPESVTDYRLESRLEIER